MDKKNLRSASVITFRAGCSTRRLTSWLANQRLSSILGLTLHALHHKIKWLTRGFWRGATRYEITLELTVEQPALNEVEMHLGSVVRFQ